MPGPSPSLLATPRLWLLHLLDGLCAQAERDLLRMQASPSVSIHALRVRMKKLAAVLRLADGRLSKADSKRLLRRITGIKNAFAEHRDQDVMKGLVRRLSERHRLPKPRLLTPLNTPSPKTSMQAVRRRLATLRRDVAALPLAGLSLREIVESYAKRERACRRMMKECRANPAPERLHAWRKRIKQWYYLNLVLHRLPHANRSIAPARRLGRHLGEVHDLVLLYGRITGPHEAEWHDTIAKRINKLEERVFDEAGHVLRFRHQGLMRKLEDETAALAAKEPGARKKQP